MTRPMDGPPSTGKTYRPGTDPRPRVTAEQWERIETIARSALRRQAQAKIDAAHIRPLGDQPESDEDARERATGG